jgi:hypothetical protein
MSKLLSLKPKIEKYVSFFALGHYFLEWFSALSHFELGSFYDGSFLILQCIFEKSLICYYILYVSFFFP